MPPRIDKSALPFGTPVHEIDRAWLDAQREERCLNCGAAATEYLSIVPAHLRPGHGGGMQYKPGDDEVVPLCDTCHRIQENGGLEFIVALFKKVARRMRLAWRESGEINWPWPKERA
jgi:hypothetical protein